MKKYENFTKEELARFVEESYSYAELSRRIGYSGGSAVKTLKEMIDKYNFNNEHFLGQSWNTGNYKTNLNRRTISNEELFCENSKYPRKRARDRIIKDEIIEYKCEICGNDGEWMGKEMPLELDHKNGKNNDNRIKNLRWLCPNCHSQTSTYRGRNKN